MPLRSHRNIACIAAMIAGTAVAAATVVTAQAGPAAERYVALGSSYASGPGIAPVADTGCARSGQNYPHLLAAARGLDPVDVTCAGATTADILNRAQRTPDGRTVPRQIDAVTPDTGLVTVTIGGNDVGLVGGMIAGSCGPAIAQAVPAAGNAARAACATVTGEQKQPAPADFEALSRSLTDIVGAIRTRAPHARILLVQYLPVVDSHATTCAAVALDAQSAAAARRTYDGLLAVTRAVAEAAGTGVTAVEVPDAEEHTACSAAGWTDGFHFPTVTDPTTVAGSYHPNRAGMTAVATEINNHLR